MKTWGFMLGTRSGKGGTASTEITSLGPDHLGSLDKAAERKWVRLGVEGPTDSPSSPSWAWLAEHLGTF